MLSVIDESVFDFCFWVKLQAEYNQPCSYAQKVCQSDSGVDFLRMFTGDQDVGHVNGRFFLFFNERQAVTNGNMANVTGDEPL
jgi:hypothetical protein